MSLAIQTSFCMSSVFALASLVPLKWSITVAACTNKALPMISAAQIFYTACPSAVPSHATGAAKN